MRKGACHGSRFVSKSTDSRVPRRVGGTQPLLLRASALRLRKRSGRDGHGQHSHCQQRRGDLVRPGVTLSCRQRGDRRGARDERTLVLSSRWAEALLLAAALIGMITPFAASAAPPFGEPHATQLVAGLEGGSGSTVGPGGALYVTEGAAGRISRVDPKTGDITTFASGLPKSIIGLGGAMDVAFIGKTAYALVTLVGPDVGGSDIVGIYRVDGPDSFTVVADIGAFALSNPPNTPFDVPTGLQYALRNLPWRVPGHRWAPQPGAAGHARRRGHRAHRVRQHRPDRAGGKGQDGVHGRGRPRPPRARGRQSGVVPAEVAHRQGGGLRCQPPRRRGVWPRSQSLRPLAGRLRWRPCGFSGAAEHRQPREGETGTALSPSSRTAWTGRPRSSSSGTPRTSSPSAGEIWKIRRVSH